MIQNIRTQIINDTALTAIVGQRVFYPAPISEQTASYITYRKVNRQRLIAQDLQEFKFFCFSKTISEIDTMGDKLIDLFEGNQITSANTYKIIFINQTDSPEKLDTGFFWTVLDFRFQRVA